jgi:Fungal specific transcription factor domain
MGMRGYWRSDSIFILSGVAVRLARRMGLHRDGTGLGLSPFETEMRRRLWWHIVHMDCRTSDFSGTRPSMDLFLSDTKIPLNVEDDDLNPQMADPPPERNGITSVVLVLVRCDIMELLRKLAPNVTSNYQWDRLTTSSITLAEKDAMISQIKDILEKKYIRYCDPSNPLHYFTTVLARSAICKMKLFAHNPRQFTDSGLKVPQTERDIIFENGIKLLEYGNLIHSTPTLRKYMWQISTSYLWDSLLYVLIEVRTRKIGPDVDRTWELIGGAFANYPQIFAEATEALYTTLGNWTLQVWDDCVAARKSEGHPESLVPEYINRIRQSRRTFAKPSPELNGSHDTGSQLGITNGYTKVQTLRTDENPMNEYESTDSYDFSNLLSFDLEANEWAQWERLFAGEGYE